MKRVICTAVPVLLADAASKLLATAYLAGRNIRLWFLAELRLVHNPGIALGMLSDMPWLALVLPPAVLLLCWYLLRDMPATVSKDLAFGMLLGGFLGNYAERILFGAVTDMLYFPWLPWFVCNIADIAVCFGVALIAWNVIAAKLNRRNKDDYE